MSLLADILARPGAFGNWAYLSDLRHLWRGSLSIAYRCVPARLRYGCGKPALEPPCVRVVLGLARFASGAFSSPAEMLAVLIAARAVLLDMAVSRGKCEHARIASSIGN